MKFVCGTHRKAADDVLSPFLLLETDLDQLKSGEELQ